MNFGESISACFSKYATFSGRASRSEYWYFFLFYVLCVTGASVISEILSFLVVLALFLPTIAVATRRLHDTNRSGWLQLLGIIPIVGFILLIVFYAQEAKEPNKYHLAAA